MDKQIRVLITGEELDELQRQTWQMTESFGLDDRIDAYQGQEPISLYRWDVECLMDVVPLALNDPEEFPDKDSAGYKALERLLARLREAYKRTYKD